MPNSTNSSSASASYHTGFLPLVKQAGSEWMEDKATKLAAALAYYSVISLAPLLVISLKVLGVIYGAKAASGQLQHQISSMAGPQVAQSVQDAIAHAGKPGAGTIATVFSAVIAFVGASGVFGELQDSLNIIWEVKPKPGIGIWGWIKTRFLSMSMVMGVTFLLLVSMVISALISGVSTHLMGAIFGTGGFVSKTIAFIIDFALSTAVITVLFAAIFKVLPDVKIRWKDVWLGGLVTALLFQGGKYLLGLYLGKAAPGSAYGAAGSLVALLVWVYYSAQILFFGAEFTQVYAGRSGSGIKPSEHAMRMTEAERTQRGAPHEGTVQAARQGEIRPEARGRPSAGIPVAQKTLLQLPPAAPMLERKKWKFGGAGMLLGAAAGAIGTYFAEEKLRDVRKPRRRNFAATLLTERLKRIEEKVGDVKTFERKVRSSDLADQVDAIGERLIQYERKNRQPQPLHREFASSFAEGFRKGYREHD